MQSSKYVIVHRILRLPWPLSDRDLLYVSCGTWRFEGPRLVGVCYYTDWKRPAVGVFLSTPESLRESSLSHPNPHLIPSRSFITSFHTLHLIVYRAD